MLAIPASAAPKDTPGYVGTEQCAACHEDVVGEFGKTSHAIAAWWDAEHSCESCHGPGAAHAESNDPADLVDFASLSVREQSETCLGCHERSASQFRSRHSTHELNQVGCMDCHSPHSIEPQMLDARGTELCGSCHADIVGQFDLPRSHPMAELEPGLLEPPGVQVPGCESCHSPHVEVFRTARLSRGPSRSENCTDCHTEKDGPFVFPHATSIVDGCSSCHSVHGSNNRHLLVEERQVNLCYSCHTGTSTPSFHSAPRFVNEKCTACHTAIHGSNSHPAFLEE